MFGAEFKYELLCDRFICLTPPNSSKGLMYGKIISHSSFSIVKGFWNWVLYQWRPQGCRYIGLDGLKPRHVHNFLTKQHFKLKFWILAILMAIRFHVTILTKFDQIFDQILAKLGQILVKIFKNQKRDVNRVQKCLISIFEKFGPLDQILMSAKFQNWSEWAKFFKKWNQAFLDPIYVTFWFLKILTKIWPSLAKIWPKIWSNLVKMVMWHNLLMSITRIQNFSLKFCLV